MMHLCPGSRLLWFLWSLVLPHGVDAGCHNDRDKDNLLRLNCTAMGFTQVPEGIEPTTQVFLFPQNQFSDLSWTSFTDFNKLHELDLSGNQLKNDVADGSGTIIDNLCSPRGLDTGEEEGPEEEGGAGGGGARGGGGGRRRRGQRRRGGPEEEGPEEEGPEEIDELSPSPSPLLPLLAVLRLGSNRIRLLQDHSFSAAPALMELYLNHNLLQDLGNQAFAGLSRLEILDLSNNILQTLPPLMMHPLVAIETLYLEGNKIQVLPDDWFSQKEEVLYLYLSANPWSCSCSHGYLRRYLEEYEGNVYVRDGPIVSLDPDSVRRRTEKDQNDQTTIGRNPALHVIDPPLINPPLINPPFFDLPLFDPPLIDPPLSDIT
uniref:LRRCT domain-containing protein n=1 Tax=Knipowitschia caucasica TaxID=637954 RepID=A0AAV2KN36_KNICA